MRMGVRLHESQDCSVTIGSFVVYTEAQVVLQSFQNAVYWVMIDSRKGGNRDGR